MVHTNTEKGTPVPGLDTTLSRTPGPSVSGDPLFGPLGVDAYLRHAPEPPNEADYALTQIASAFEPQKADAVRQRLAMWENLEALQAALASAPKAEPIRAIYDFMESPYMLKANPKAAEQLAYPYSGLGSHLEEIRVFAADFFLVDGHASRFPGLTDRQAQLLAYVVTPLHDVLKFLGTPAAQVLTDHEVMAGEIARGFEKRELGMPFDPKSFSREDAEFVSWVVAHHENIFKEQGRTDWIHSPDPAKRAAAMFFVADTLTGVLEPNDRGGWRMNAELLDRRFTDLYYRHMDPIDGKIFPARPEWGLAAVADLTATLRELGSHVTIEGLTEGSSPRQALIVAAIEGNQRALDAHEARKADVTVKKRLSGAELDHIRDVQVELRGMLE